MTEVLEILNPVAQLASELRDPLVARQRPRTLEGIRVGLYWNRKQSGNYALERVGELLKQHYAGMETRLYLAQRPVSEDLIREITANSDLVVGGVGD